MVIEVDDRTGEVRMVPTDQVPVGTLVRIGPHLAIRVDSPCLQHETGRVNYVGLNGRHSWSGHIEEVEVLDGTLIVRRPR